MFLGDCAEFGRKVKLNKPNDKTSYRIVQLGNSGSTTVPGAIRGNYYYDTTKGSRWGLVVNDKGRGYNLPRIESQNGIDNIYVGERLSNQKRLMKKVRRRGNKTYKNTRKVTQTIDASPKTTSSKKSTYTPKNLSEVDTTPRQTVSNNPTTPKPQSQKTSNPKVNTSSSIPAKPKSSRKLINKYTLGGLGVLGGAAATYGGYKLLTRNKNKKEK